MGARVVAKAAIRAVRGTKAGVHRATARPFPVFCRRRRDRVAALSRISPRSIHSRDSPLSIPAAQLPVVLSISFVRSAAASEA